MFLKLANIAFYIFGSGGNTIYNEGLEEGIVDASLVGELGGSVDSGIFNGFCGMEILEGELNFDGGCTFEVEYTRDSEG